MKKFIPIVYLGSYCNQNCSYCDRGYIKDEIGDQRLDPKDIPAVIDFIKKNTPDKHVAFHGGEPFLYVKQMRQIIDALPNYVFSILTNGTLLDKNRKFLEDYNKRLNISISYDFTRMITNRGYTLDIKHSLFLLEKYNCNITQLQWVIDMRDKKCFDIEILKSITDLYSKYNIGLITLIPMRHIRGKTKFRSIMDSVDIQDFMRGFLQFIQMLYVLKIKVSIDGHSHAINKEYFNNHKQAILSPDGYLYPEFDFLDYKIETARIGNWKTGEINRWTNADGFLSNRSCHNCSQFYNCGLKYLYHMFDQEPGTKCETFYKLLEGIVQHNGRLNKYKNLIQAVK